MRLWHNLYDYQVTEKKPPFQLFLSQLPCTCTLFAKVHPMHVRNIRVFIKSLDYNCFTFIYQVFFACFSKNPLFKPYFFPTKHLFPVANTLGKILVVQKNNSSVTLSPACFLKFFFIITLFPFYVSRGYQEITMSFCVAPTVCPP